MLVVLAVPRDVVLDADVPSEVDEEHPSMEGHRQVSLQIRPPQQSELELHHCSRSLQLVWSIQEPPNYAPSFCSGTARSRSHKSSSRPSWNSGVTK